MKLFWKKLLNNWAINYRRVFNLTILQDFSGYILVFRFIIWKWTDSSVFYNQFLLLQVKLQHSVTVGQKLNCKWAACCLVVDVPRHGDLSRCRSACRLRILSSSHASAVGSLVFIQFPGPLPVQYPSSSAVSCSCHSWVPLRNCPFHVFVCDCLIILFLLLWTINSVRVGTASFSVFRLMSVRRRFQHIIAMDTHVWYEWTASEHHAHAVLKFLLLALSVCVL